MPAHRIFTTPFADVYPLYVQKAMRKGRTKEEVDRVVAHSGPFALPEQVPGYRPDVDQHAEQFHQ